MKPKKICREDHLWPLYKAFQDDHWELSGGTKHCAVLMASIIAAYDIRNVLEIGLWQGFMTKHLVTALAANAANSSLLISCDINPAACTRAQMVTAGLPVEHRVIVGDSKETLKTITEKFGLIFIDGDHSYESAKSDIHISKDLLLDNGIMMVHDYSRGFLGVYQAVNEFIETSKWPSFFIPENRISTDYRAVMIQKGWKYK